VRYYSPVAEVAFCGHATIALGHVLGSQGLAGADGMLTLDTLAGPVPLRVAAADGVTVSTLESVTPSHVDADPALVAAVLDHLGWSADDLDRRLTPAVAHAGVHHLVLAAASRERLADLDYAFEDLRTTMLEHDLTTVALVWSLDWVVVHARNPFPVGGVVEDPATGAAAAALGGLLRDRGLIPTPHVMTVRQGEDMGRPSTIDVQIPAAGGILVSGTSVDMPA
jgi:PhzF family phenazine biosynthesis protein